MQPLTALQRRELAVGNTVLGLTMGLVTAVLMSPAVVNAAAYVAVVITLAATYRFFVTAIDASIGGVWDHSYASSARSRLSHRLAIRVGHTALGLASASRLPATIVDQRVRVIDP